MGLGPRCHRFQARTGRDDGRGGAAPGRRSAPAADAREEEEPPVRCRQCGFAITRPRDAVARGGAHRHTFANPHGIVFEIGCFAAAPGCAQAGPATDEFSWFGGYRWRVALCGGCLTHLGWRFAQAGGDNFHGLILDRLDFPA